MLETLESGDAYDQGRRIFERIRAVPRVIRVTCKGKRLVVHTDRLYCYGPTAAGYRWYRLGRYDIYIYLDGRGADWVIWKAFEVDHPGGVLAPQIPKEGIVKCFGDEARALIDSARHTLRYDTIINVLVRFTECPMTSVGMHGWPIVHASEVPAWYRTAPLQWDRT